MGKLNIKPEKLTTHEGGRAVHINPELQLRRSVMACLLWEDQFYEDGETIADRIANTVALVYPDKVAEIAIEARGKMKLRHVPLLIIREMARIKTHKHLTSPTLAAVIQRPDELAEFLAIYWKEKKQPLSKQVKLGLAEAFTKFDAYQLAKWNRDDKIKLRDVLFLCHAKPKNKEQETTWKKLVDGTLEAPDTWEVGLSAGKDKKETWTRLISENKLGALALLRNLRNMQQAGVDESIIFSALENMNVARVLPFRFISAALAVPQWESQIEKAMMKCLAEQKPLVGKTVLLIDVSGSMENDLSKKSTLKRVDAACGIAILARELCSNVRVFTFSNELAVVPPRHGFALRDAIVESQDHAATWLDEALTKINENYDRIIIITDEQAHDDISTPKGKGYVINVGSYKNGIGYGIWTHIDGFSEAVLNYIREKESSNV